MALTPNFSAAQTIGLPSVISLTDTSTGSDGSIASRKVYMTTYSGQYLTSNGLSDSSAYTTWVYSASTIAIDCLLQDMALLIRVDWVDSGGTVLYTKTILEVFTLYGVTESFNLSQGVYSDGSLLQDQNYWMNRMILRCNIEDGQDAVTLMGNIAISQGALDREKFMIDNESKFF